MRYLMIFLIITTTASNGYAMSASDRPTLEEQRAAFLEKTGYCYLCKKARKRMGCIPNTYQEFFGNYCSGLLGLDTQFDMIVSVLDKTFLFASRTKNLECCVNTRKAYNQLRRRVISRMENALDVVNNIADLKETK